MHAQSAAIMVGHYQKVEQEPLESFAVMYGGIKVKYSKVYMRFASHGEKNLSLKLLNYILQIRKVIPS